MWEFDRSWGAPFAYEGGLQAIRSFCDRGIDVTTRSAVIIGVFVLLAGIVHAGVLTVWPKPALRPLHTGRVAGDINYRIDANTTSQHKVNGCRVEIYDTFVLVYIDKKTAPTWTDNYVLPIAWRQIESLTLMPE
jgi:mannose/fructose/N-acetylgalactosamine-specific phosphotransferase system component IID